MNYHSDEELAQVIEEPDRRPVPASRHVALNSTTGPTPRKDRALLKAGLFAGTVFGFVVVANIWQLSSIVLTTAAIILVGVFVFDTIKGEKIVRRH
jgi:tetrahydromethanopterin S-methyltransferase subunit B